MMKVDFSEITISSLQNPRFKQWREWMQDARKARQASKALIEGVHLCQSFLNSGRLPNCVVLHEKAYLHPEVASLLTHLLHLFRDQSHEILPVAVLSESLFKQLSGVINGVGICFEIELPVTELNTKLTRSCVVLDGVQDPGNTGTILRTAAAAGIESVLTTPNSALLWSAKVLRAAMGAHFCLNLFEQVEIEQFQTYCQLPCYATSPHAALNLYHTNFAHECVWIFGHEGLGVSQAWFDLATPLSIPQHPTVESLNVAAAAAVCLFEQRRQCLYQSE